ncbi:hypothetical protein TNCV_2689261 [Trichonephila clavipes]|nr:hypothetical protein TNCV_2689261 [Trichonephila clavipes]
MNSNLVPLKTRRVGERRSFNLSRAQTSSRCFIIMSIKNDSCGMPVSDGERSRVRPQTDLELQCSIKIYTCKCVTKLLGTTCFCNSSDSCRELPWRKFNLFRITSRSEYYIFSPAFSCHARTGYKHLPHPAYDSMPASLTMYRVTSTWGHWVLFDLGQAQTPRQVVIMVKREPAPIDNRRSLYEKNTVAMTGVERMGL